MSITVRELNRHFVDLWWESDTSLPELGSAYTVRMQTENEKQLLHFLEVVQCVLTDLPHSREDVQAQQARLGAAFRSLAEESLGFGAAQLDRLPSKAFSEASEQFVRRARAFDPGLSGEDIYQAGRNAWTANGLQWLLGLPVQVTPSILAYSLLYPYTDNYLDDPAVDVASKRAFNDRFQQRLAGESIATRNSHEGVIFKLVEMIEEQYPRPAHPQVFESLLAIHRAQAKSLKLIRPSAAPGEVDVIGLSFEKGGASVLADGHLVSDSLTEAQHAYTYGHGIFAQLLDDMEDIESDSRAGRLTLYSQPAGHWSLDALANRTFHFGHRVLAGLDCFDVDESIRQLIWRGADLLLIDVIGRTDGHYSPAYLSELESHSPFRFSFLREQRKSFTGRQGSFKQLINKAMLLATR